MPKRTQTVIEAAEFARGEGGPILRLPSPPGDLPLSDQPAWQSNGGPTRGHPARSFPFSFEAAVPEEAGSLIRIHLLGVFALYSDRAAETVGTLGASLQLVQDREVVMRHDLLNGRHYSDGRDLAPVHLLLGDGTSRETVGVVEVGGVTCRVDLLTVDVPPGTEATSLRFRDLGSPASFIVFDVCFEFEPAKGCPFRSKQGGVSLAELGAVVRLGDRVRFARAVQQLEQGLLQALDLDEARGEALTFLAIVTSGTLERGGTREMHREQLEAARELDRLESREEIAAATLRRLDSISGVLFHETHSPSGHLVDRALAIVERNFAKDLNDASVADQLGLSTSHFRFLFRQATGQPFHKYLVALRLEKARRMLMDGDMAVSDVARAVGFSGLSHFSRAFAQRFQASPTSIKRGTS